MPETLAVLETQRSAILSQLSRLGDLRAGSICAVTRRCGKPTCHCAKPKDRGHDPQIRLTRKIEGKTVAETFASPVAFRKAQAEIGEYHRFHTLGAQLVEVNEKICRLRPLPEGSEGWSTQEKKRLLRSMQRSRGR